ncbi:MAG: 16S rRNA (guanine(527)-N(7))-methyltransferase RsmG [Hyphomicrobiales bacterium]
MEIGSAEWSQLIIDGAASWGMALRSDHLRLFADHAQELLKWNAVTNLTAITQPEDIAKNHFLDSLASAGLVTPGSNLLDIGSGGGFPGLPLHIFVPGLHTTLLDAARKKVSFLRHVARKLDLRNIEAVQDRVEGLAHQPGRVRHYDVIVSRAFSALDFFVRTALPLLKPNGRMVAFKAGISPAELDDLQNAAGSGAFGAVLFLEVRYYAIAGLKSERALLVVGQST